MKVSCDITIVNFCFYNGKNYGNIPKTMALWYTMKKHGTIPKNMDPWFTKKEKKPYVSIPKTMKLWFTMEKVWHYAGNNSELIKKKPHKYIWDFDLQWKRTIVMVLHVYQNYGTIVYIHS